MSHAHDRGTEGPRFRKSSYSANANGSCVEVADADARIAVRDSKNPTGPTLAFNDTDWTTFAQGVRDTTA